MTRQVSSPSVQPVTFLTAETPAPTQRRTTAGNATVKAGSGEEKPQRRARRATSDGKTAPVSSGTPTRESADIDVIASIAALTGKGVEAPTQASSNTPNFAAIEQAIDLDTVEKQHDKQHGVRRDSADKKPAGSSRRSTAKKTATAQTPPAPVEEAAAEPAKEAAQDKPRRQRTRPTREVFSAPAPAAQERPAAPSRPRLATTALLFQAPDLTTVPPAPSVPEEPAQVAEETAEQPAEQTPQKTQRQRRSRADKPAQRAASRPVPDAEEAPEEEEETSTSPEAETPESSDDSPRRRRRRGSRGRRNRNGNGSEEDASDDETQDNTPEAEQPEDVTPEASTDDSEDDTDSEDAEESASSRRRRRRRRTRGEETDATRRRSTHDEVTALKGSTRLEAKRQRRREGRDAGRRRSIITESEFLARRESVDRSMVVREVNGRTQIAVLEDGILVEHYVSQQEQASIAGNVYLGRVQNVLPSMEAAFVDIGKGRNAVLYAGEVNWDVHGIEGQPRRIEEALKSGDSVLVQVTKDPIGHKGARLTSQITLAGRYLVYVPGGGMTGISRKLPDTERSRLKRILKELVAEGAGVIVRTAAEGASEEELRADIHRLQTQWEKIEKKRKSANAPALLQGEPDLAIRVVRDIFNDDFNSLTVQGDQAWQDISEYVTALAPDLADKVKRWTSEQDIFAGSRIDEQLAKGMDRKVWLPSGGSLVIDRTEAMTVIDVNTGKFTGVGGTLEETVTRNNLESAEEIVRQLRLRDIGGIIVIDFIDMVLESNRDLVLRRLVECLGRDRTKHQVAEVTSLGLVQMTRKRVGQGLVEAFSTTCDHCNGRGFVVHADPVEKGGVAPAISSPQPEGESKRSKRRRSKDSKENKETKEASERQAQDSDAASQTDEPHHEDVTATLAAIAAAAVHAHDSEKEKEPAASTPLQEKKSEVTSPDAVSSATAAPQGSESSPEVATDKPVKAAPRTRSRRAGRSAGRPTGQSETRNAEVTPSAAPEETGGKAVTQGSEHDHTVADTVTGTPTSGDSNQ
ncbi:Rne/Rng family ribonuclease [Jonesia quinghaiensis]|uniref:Rne/Rng family ribonuclease n=1 Tax=Jonesia quinghaiensis TaxID=262806 RepID=UPI00041EA416